MSLLLLRRLQLNRAQSPSWCACEAALLLAILSVALSCDSPFLPPSLPPSLPHFYPLLHPPSPPSLQVTDLLFLDGPRASHRSLLLSVSRDAQLRVWDLTLRMCVQTIAQPRGELCSLHLHPSLPLLVAAGSEPHLSLFSLSDTPTPTGFEASESTHSFAASAPPTSSSLPIPNGSSGSGGGTSSGGVSAAAAAAAAAGTVLREAGQVSRAQRGNAAADKIRSVRFDAAGHMLVCQTAGKAVEFYR